MKRESDFQHWSWKDSKNVPPAHFADLRYAMDRKMPFNFELRPEQITDLQLKMNPKLHPELYRKRIPDAHRGMLPELRPEMHRTLIPEMIREFRPEVHPELHRKLIPDVHRNLVAEHEQPELKPEIRPKPDRLEMEFGSRCDNDSPLDLSVRKKMKLETEDNPEMNCSEEPEYSRDPSVAFKKTILRRYNSGI